MGNKAPKKNLVIIGGSYAGLILLDKVKNDFNVTLIEKKDHFEWIWSLPKSIIEPEYFRDEATVDLHKSLNVDKICGDHF